MPPLSLDDTSGRLPERILAAMEREIREGRWKAGMKLPPQRQMALSLKVSLGAVTAAYAHAEARGLVRGEVGRGTFVRGSADLASPSGPFDLAHNIAPTHIAGPRLSQALLRLARQDTLADCAAYPEPAGAPGQRRAVAAWIARTTLLPDSVQDLAVRLICVNGAQQGCAVALAAILRPGERLIVESPTFTGVRVLAAHMGYPLTGLALDAEGASPESLEAAAATGARVAYLQPLHNPTGRVMGLARRQALVEVARRRDLYLVEDDLYGAYASELTLPPLAALAPERVFYVGGLSKSLAPGLRFGYCLPPNEDRFRQGHRFARHRLWPTGHEWAHCPRLAGERYRRRDLGRTSGKFHAAHRACLKMARRAGGAPPPPRRHPSLGADEPVGRRAGRRSGRSVGRHDHPAEP